MKNEQVLELMNAIPPDLIEEADIQAPAKRRLPKLARVGLIAACLCLALLGTAAAAQFLNVQIHERDENGIIWMSNGIAYHPYDSLSDEIKAWADSGEAYINCPVGSWEAAEALIGFDLMNNPVLDAAAPRAATVDGVYGRFFVQTGPHLGQIKTTGRYSVDRIPVTVYSYFYTDHMAGDWNEKFLGLLTTEAEGTEQYAYTTPGGLEVQIEEIAYDSFTSCWAAFSLNGVPFVVIADTDPTVSGAGIVEARAALLQVLDGFVLQQTP